MQTKGPVAASAKKLAAIAKLDDGLAAKTASKSRSDTQAAMLDQFLLPIVVYGEFRLQSHVHDRR